MAVHQTPVTYSAAEAAQIRDQASVPDTTLRCPRCTRELVRYPPVTHKGRQMQEVCCPDCNRCLMIPV